MSLKSQTTQSLEYFSSSSDEEKKKFFSSIKMWYCKVADYSHYGPDEATDWSSEVLYPVCLFFWSKETNSSPFDLTLPLSDEEENWLTGWYPLISKSQPQAMK